MVVNGQLFRLTRCLAKVTRLSLLAEARPHFGALRSAAELRQKAREWLSRSALNRIREDAEVEQSNGATVHDV
jgi:hypothetical protein